MTLPSHSMTFPRRARGDAPKVSQDALKTPLYAPSPFRTRMHERARTHARTHACTHARTHARTDRGHGIR